MVPRWIHILICPPFFNGQPWLIDWLTLGSSPYGPDALGLIDRPFVLHNLISTQESPVPLLNFQMAPQTNLNGLWVQERNPDILFFSLRSPCKRTPSRFPNRDPMMRESRLQGILHLSQKPHLSCSPVKGPSLKVPFMESLAVRCPTTRALLHSSIEVPGIWAPQPTYQVPLEWWALLLYTQNSDQQCSLITLFQANGDRTASQSSSNCHNLRFYLTYLPRTHQDF